jgi:hypothetical protein
MKTIIVGDGQTIFDIAIQEYGGIEGILLLMSDNGDKIPSITSELKAGLKLKIKSLPVNASVVASFAQGKIKPATKLSPEMYGGGDFNDDFNDDLN